MHKIDLSKYEIRTDMALDILEKEKDKSFLNEYEKDNVKISWIKLEEDNNIGKKKGEYLTLEFDDVTDTEYKDKVKEVFKEELKSMLNKINYNKNYKTLVVGLGNIKTSADALGPLVINNVIVTSHLFDMKIDVDNKFSNVSAFFPGVTGETGIETKDYIKAVVDKINPDLLIVVDSLASSSLSRINRSIQVSNTGISPGSGVGNKREEISSKTIGIPTIVIGVPTVASASLIVADTINYMIKNYVYNKKLNNKKVSKFINKQVNYLKDNVEVTIEDKKTLLGLVGTLNEEELINLTYEVLTPVGYNLMVTPKEEDFIIKKISDIISYGINNSLHDI